MLLVSLYVIDINVLELNIHFYVLFNYQLYYLLVITEDPPDWAKFISNISHKPFKRHNLLNCIYKRKQFSFN